MNKEAGTVKLTERVSLSYMIGGDGSEYYATLLIDGNLMRNADGAVIGGWWRTNDLETLVERVRGLYRAEIEAA